MIDEQIQARPTGSLVSAVRQRHGFTQLQCAYVSAVSARAWQGYEAKDGSMPLPTWWLFLLRIGEILPSQLPPIPPRQRVGGMIGLAK